MKSIEGSTQAGSAHLIPGRTWTGPGRMASGGREAVGVTTCVPLT